MEEDLMMQFEVEFARVVRLYYSRMQAQLAEVGLYRGSRRSWPCCTSATA